jgi:hypothetical protein
MSVASANFVPLTRLVSEQGDQIGRNFAIWATFKDTGIFGGEIWFVVGILRV